ncbi:MAG: hypothetical protein A3H98_10885 [Bacteroidetes bacterium RIFCSPLOWO2_02_FULL_36_8]|nr:MAG: hypothetical protein A3H98_10885 [Bacteroidetes bacterium RIFCSPLOWO2_02_FULL_36_8]OFY71263.1 MAG: hypothetical protein A3G23_01975 [Bacteroidetes bacterium RIFCSPLOWO2_12_FULL_37_12]
MIKTFLLLILMSANCYSQNSDSIPVVTITTDFGEIKFVLSDKTPKHKENFLKLIKEGFYDGTTFHRIIPGFMIQGGDGNSKDTIPMNDGTGDMPYLIPAEFNATLKHYKGAVAAARKGDMVNPTRSSSGSQFYIVQNPTGEHRLDGEYTVFGQTISGMEVVDKISMQARDRNNRPVKNIKMKVTVTYEDSGWMKKNFPEGIRNY